MTDLSAFPITQQWPAQHPDRLQLYSMPTPNGVKIPIMLEEIGLPYEVHKVDFAKDDQHSPAFLSLNPNNKIPAILIYLADKTGMLMPQDPAARYQVIQWVMFQIGSVGPMFGQLGFFHKFAGKDIEDKRPRDRYVDESRRLLGVINGQLAQHAWIAGDEFTIADIAIFPWINGLLNFYEAGDLVGITDFPHVSAALTKFLARPSVQKGLKIPAP
jgi:GST-like protein